MTPEQADASVPQSLWIGDSCGYLAAQAEARIAAGLKPTDEQLEAWAVCNTTEKSFEEVDPT